MYYNDVYIKYLCVLLISFGYGERFGILLSFFNIYENMDVFKFNILFDEVDLVYCKLFKIYFGVFVLYDLILN